MNTIFSTSIAINSTLLDNTQIESISTIDKDIQVMTGIIILIALISFTILTLIKRWMDYRLKNKSIDLGLSENVINSILQDGANRNKNSNIKWFAILAGVGTALTIINYTLPLGIHSIAIMAFSVSTSFLGYFFFLKYTDKQND
jgi:drug/metabolite transporter (DMT)-like permease